MSLEIFEPTVSTEMRIKDTEDSGPLTYLLKLALKLDTCLEKISKT